MLKYLLVMLIAIHCFSDEIIRLDQSEDLRNFRLMKTSCDSEEQLPFSASAQFSVKGLDELQSKLDQKNLIILDLRREPHGFINGMPVSFINTDQSWTNENLSLQVIEEDEKARLKAAMRQGTVQINKEIKDGAQRSYEPFDVKVESYTTESNLAAMKGIGYVRIPVCDHMRPSNIDVDGFLQFYKTIPEKTWVHMHCKGGRGRSTTFFVMIDMIHHAKDLSFQEIMDCQNDYNNTSLDVPVSPIAKEYIEEFNDRLDFLKSFYDYANENQDNFETPYSAWLKKRTKEIQS